jgi:hypothetical protein
MCRVARSQVERIGGTFVTLTKLDLILRLQNVDASSTKTYALCSASAPRAAA